MSEATPPLHRRTDSYISQNLQATLQANRTLYTHRKAQSHVTGPSVRREPREQQQPQTVSSESVKAFPLAVSTNEQARRPSVNKADASAEIAHLRDKLARAETELTALKKDKESRRVRDEGKISRQEYAELERQFAAQEALLSGYQRENERSMEELVSLRRVKKQMESHLQRLYGDDWLTEVQSNNTPGTGTRRPFTSPSMTGRTYSTLKSPRVQSIAEAPSPVTGLHEDDDELASPTPQSQASSAMAAPALPPGLDATALLEQLDAIKTLVKTQEMRLLQRAAELEMRASETKA